MQARQGSKGIINIKRKEVTEFLENDLLPQVTEALEASKGGRRSKLDAQRKELEERLTADGVEPRTSKKWQELSVELTEVRPLAELEEEVFSHLLTFFSRYYDNGDIMSKRRFKRDTYAIPYEGEEVKLVWANMDQYYVKTILPSARRRHQEIGS